MSEWVLWKLGIAWYNRKTRTNATTYLNNHMCARYIINYILSDHISEWKRKLIHAFRYRQNGENAVMHLPQRSLVRWSKTVNSMAFHDYPLRLLVSCYYHYQSRNAWNLLLYGIFVTIFIAYRLSLYAEIHENKCCIVFESAFVLSFFPHAHPNMQWKLFACNWFRSCFVSNRANFHSQRYSVHPTNSHLLPCI